MVCLATFGLSTEKIGTAPDLPDRPNRLIETKTTHIEIFHCESGERFGLPNEEMHT
jgi:hypothetical protein